MYIYNGLMFRINLIQGGLNSEITLEIPKMAATLKTLT